MTNRDIKPKVIYLLTVMHASRDIPTHLAEMEPSLATDVELLRKHLGNKMR